MFSQFYCIWIVQLTFLCSKSIFLRYNFPFVKLPQIEHITTIKWLKLQRNALKITTTKNFFFDIMQKELMATITLGVLVVWVHTRQIKIESVYWHFVAFRKKKNKRNLLDPERTNVNQRIAKTVDCCRDVVLFCCSNAKIFSLPCSTQCCIARETKRKLHRYYMAQWYTIYTM